MQKSASDRDDILDEWEESLRQSFRSFCDKYEHHYVSINPNFRLTIKEILFAFLNANNLFSESHRLSFSSLYLLDRFIRLMPKYFDLGMIGLSYDMLDIYEKIEKYASTDKPVLIYGETGTGKELVANALHKFSSRKGKPFIPVNCAAIPQSTIESELFGYEKGSHSKADKAKIGYFEAANQSTLFLDEIADLSLDAQAKLLRVLQEKRVIRVGGTQEVKTNFRLISATNKNLSSLVDARAFRQDLYSRIADGLRIEVQPLWQHWEDIPFMFYYFICSMNSATDPSLTAGQLYDILTARWPRNVRQLQNQAALFAIDREFSTEIQPREFGPPDSLLVMSKIKSWNKFCQEKYSIYDLPAINIPEFMHEVYSFFGIEFDMNCEIGVRVDHIYPEKKDMSKILESYLLDPVSVPFELIARHNLPLDDVEKHYLKAVRKLHPAESHSALGKLLKVRNATITSKFKKYGIE